MLKDTDGLVGTFDGGYGRLGQIWVDNNTCDLCDRENVRCINIDGSEGEYECGSVCEQCARMLYWDPKKEFINFMKKYPPPEIDEEKDNG